MKFWLELRFAVPAISCVEYGRRLQFFEEFATEDREPSPVFFSTVRKHVVAGKTLAGGGECVCVEESADFGVVVAAL